MAQGGETPGLTMARRRDLFLDLYALTEEACKTLSATEEGIRIYMLEVRLAQGRGIISVGALATCCWRACSTQTLKPMLGVPLSLAWFLKTVQMGYKSQKKEDQCRQRWSFPSALNTKPCLYVSSRTLNMANVERSG